MSTLSYSGIISILGLNSDKSGLLSLQEEKDKHPNVMAVATR
jgi:hypothetical protein